VVRYERTLLNLNPIYKSCGGQCRTLRGEELSTRPNLKIDNKLKSKRDKASIVSAIFCGDIHQFNMFEF